MKNFSNASIAHNPGKITTSEQKMGLPPAHEKTMGGILNPESRRRLSQIFCGRGVQGRKNVEQFPPPGYSQTQSLKHVSTGSYQQTNTYNLRREQSPFFSASVFTFLFFMRVLERLGTNAAIRRARFPRFLEWAMVIMLSFSCAVALGLPLDTPEFILEFDNEQGRLVRLFDKKTSHEHVGPETDGDLWVVELPENAGGVLRPSDAKTFAVQASEPEQVRLSWIAFGRESMPNLSVEISVSYDAKQSAGYWDIVICGLEKTVPAVVRFPRLPNIVKQESEVLAVPYWMGEKTTRARELLSPSQGKSTRREFSYPGLLSLQCMAFYRDGGPGLYIAADDIAARSKSFAAFGDGQGGIGLEVCHFPGTDALAESVYTPGYHVLVGVFQGDWLTAAERYRNWALEQPWARESRLKQGSTPDWVKDTAFWVWNRGISEGVLPPAAILQEYLGMPVSVFWHWWHGCAYDVGFPEYLPPREGTVPFKEAVRAARAQGLNAIVYMNQRLWGMTTDSWAAENAERWAVKKPDGTVQPEVYNTFTKAPNASMCMGTPFWRNKYAGLSESVFNDLGVSGIYMDQACSSLVCYDTGHGHAPGGGDYWMKGFQFLEADIRKRCPGIGLAGEGCGEAWLPHLDLMLSLQVSRERFMAPGTWEPIPFFQAVYHGYAVLYGNYASLTRPPYDPLWPAEFAPERPLELLDEKFRYQFRLEQARSFVWGQQPCLANFKPELLTERKADMRYLRQLARLRQQALPWLLYGTFVRPPHMDIPDMEVDMSRLSIYAGQREAVQEFRMSVPQYLADAWRDDKGNLAVAVANIADADQPLHVTLSRSEHGLPERGMVYKMLPESRVACMPFENGEATVTDTLPGAGVCLYEFQSE